MSKAENKLSNADPAARRSGAQGSALQLRDLKIGDAFYLLEWTMPDGRYPASGPLILRKKCRDGIWEADQGYDAFGAQGLAVAVTRDAEVILPNARDETRASATNISDEP